VCTEGRLILEFAFDDLMRIKTWHFNIRQYRELIPRSILAMHVSLISSLHPIGLSYHMVWVEVFVQFISCFAKLFVL